MRQRRPARVGQRGPQRRPPADLSRGRRPGRGALREPARPDVDRGPHRGERARRAGAVPDGAHRRRTGQCRRVVPRPVRRRARRRRGVGPRGDRHAQHHLVDGRRVPPARHRGLPAAGHADLLRRRRRGGRRTVGRGVHGRQPLGRGRRRVRAHRVRRLVADPRRRDPQHHRQRRREGPRLAAAAGSRDARARLDALRRRQRADHRGGGRPAARRLPDDSEPRRSVVGPPGRDRPSRRPAGRVVRSGFDRRRDRLAPAALRPRRPRLLAHDDLPERHPRRPEDEHDPRRHRHRRRRAHGPRRHQGRRRPLLRRSPRRPGRPEWRSRR